VHLNPSEKIQFFETSPRTKAPRVCTNLWGFENVYIESLEEILAKKIRFRGDKGNTRDIFDIALGLAKNPSLIQEALECGAFSKEHLNALKRTLEAIASSKDLMQIYEMEIDFIDPAPQYKELALNAPKFLLEKLL
jgi:predicted nucleotidyltransferase component of viral defense system